MLGAERIKFEPALPPRHRDAIAKLSLGTYEHVALELKGNPLQAQNDDLIFEKPAGPRTAALLANVSGTPLCMVEVAGKIARELQGEAAMVDFATGWLADLYGADVKKAIGKTSATTLEPRSVHARRVLGRRARRPGRAAGADGAGARSAVLRR